MKIKTVAPTRTSSGKVGKIPAFKIIGINRIAPAGGKSVLILSKATNRTQQASPAQRVNGKCSYKFNISRKKQPVADAKVIKPIM